MRLARYTMLPMREKQEEDLWGTKVPAGWNKAVLFAALRIIVISTLIVLVSFLSGPPGLTRNQLITTSSLYLLFWGTLYILFFRRQMKLIRKADFPNLRATEALVLGLVLFLAIFAKGYYLLSENYSGAFSEPLDHFTSFYFTITVLATVGFGDITPIIPLARGFAMIQMLLDLVLIAISVRLVTREVQRNQQERRAAGSTSETTSS